MIFIYICQLLILVYYYCIIFYNVINSADHHRISTQINPHKHPALSLTTLTAPYIPKLPINKIRQPHNPRPNLNQKLVHIRRCLRPTHIEDNPIERNS